MKLKDLLTTIRSLKNPAKAKIFQWFFKTNPGEYGHGDKFLGLTVPQMRKLSKQFKDLSLSDLQKLLKSPYHEERLVALLISVIQFPQNPKTIYNFYLQNTAYINNWDLVDLTAPRIVGQYLSDKPRDILYKLAKSESLWERRIAIISCFYFIKQKSFQDTLKISQILLSDKQDLIHKAVGWMLREVGKQDETVLLKFLKQNYSQIPRTTLRYAIEKFPETQRKACLKGDIKINLV